MKYTLIEDYFESVLFQNIVQEYFDTILLDILNKHSIYEAKGLFIKNGKPINDNFDMPYHIHILEGMIPSLYIYERLLINKGWINKTETTNKEAELYIKTFILGFSFHDINKLYDESCLEVAVKELSKRLKEDYPSLTVFFNEFEKHKNDVLFLCLSDEDRTCVYANQYQITLSERHMKEVLSLLCKFADSLASNQNLTDIESLFNSVLKSFSIISSFTDIEISYVKINKNPYTLLSQSLLQSARMILAEKGKKVFMGLRDGFIYFGSDITDEEYKNISKLNNNLEDINPLSLIKIDAQSCNFGFIGSIPFTVDLLNKITEKSTSKFFSLSPNSEIKIGQNYERFKNFNNELINTISKNRINIPLSFAIEKNKNLSLRPNDKDLDIYQTLFLKIFCLHKIQWLNTKKNIEWKKDLDKWKNKEDKIDFIKLKIEEEEIETNKSCKDIFEYLKSMTKSSDSWTKNYLNIIKTTIILDELNWDEDEIELYKSNLENEIITFFDVPNNKKSLIEIFSEKYLTYKGQKTTDFFKTYNPIIPNKNEMCAFTGGIGTIQYNESIAFSLKSRGGHNRTVTALNNHTSHISELFAEENRLRKSTYNIKDANLVVYYDFFETHLDIDKSIFDICIKTKDVKIIDKVTILFDRNSKFEYNLDNLFYINLSSSIENQFYFIRKQLLLLKLLGIRTFATGIMSPYRSHKEAFLYDNAPKIISKMGWNKVRLIDVTKKIDEMNMILSISTDSKNKKKTESNLKSNIFRLSNNMNSLFTIFYFLSEDKKKSIYNTLVNFIKNNIKLFYGMTVTKQLAELATKISLLNFNSSGSEETWLIRVALDFIRKDKKEGFDKDNTIEQICGAIDKKVRLQSGNRDERSNAIKAFAKSVYEELYETEWKKALPNINREKDWIYQFAFLYREASLKILNEKIARQIIKGMHDQGLDMTEKNIKSFLKENKKEKYAEKYIKIINELN